MADISLTCKSCSHVFAISEFVNKPEVECVKCGTSIEVPKAASRTKLKLKPRDTEADANSVKNSIAEGFKERKAQEKIAATESLGDKAKKVSSAWEWVIFLIVAGALISTMVTLYNGNGSEQMLTVYRIAMWILVPSVWIAVIASGFGQSKMTGFALILVAPYWLYFALSRIDAKLLRGFATAIILTVGAEFHFLPQESLIRKLQTNVNSVVTGTQESISRPAEIEFTDGR